MTKRSLRVTLLIICIIFAACVAHQSSDEQGVSHNTAGKARLTDTFSRFIAVDTANKMLSSYLTSINYSQNDSDLQSLIVNVQQLRRYIDSMPNSAEITNVKLMFAHTLSYTNSSRVNTNAGYNSNALTLIIVAYNDSGNYIYYTGNKVLDYTEPCPPVCPPGNAGGAFLTVER